MTEPQHQPQNRTWPVPSVRLAIAAAVLSVLVLVLPSLGRVSLGLFELDGRFVVVNVLLVSAAILDFVAAPAVGDLAVRRVHPSSVTLGHETNLTWEVSQRQGNAGEVWLADALAPSLGADTRRVRLSVPRRGTASATTRLRPTRRGRFRPDEITIRTSGPLGLVFRQQRRVLRTELRVLPPFRSAKTAELSLRKARILEVGLRSAKGRGGGTEFDSLRELTPDDETRRIDWAATARTGRAIVRTFRAERNQTVLVMLDTGRVTAGRVDDVPRVEHAMDGAMLLAELATGLGDKMGLVAFDRTVHTTLEPSNRRSQRARVTEAVFDIEPALASSDYRLAMQHVLGRYRRRHLLVLLTELGEEETEQFLLPSLPLLLRTHLVVVAAVQDPELDRWAGTPSRDEEGAFLRSAAIAELEARRRTAAKLRSKGIIVIDEPPERFSAALGDAYLDAKAVGRL